jgi:hypothetical protein
MRVIGHQAKLFSQPLRDGYEVLETYDKYADGVIDAKDEVFTSLRVWRDPDQDGITDAGITSVLLIRTNVTGTNQGHDRGFQGGFTRTNGTQITAETIRFQTDGMAYNRPGIILYSIIFGQKFRYHYRGN